jgi:hypothetical protein
MSNFTKTEAGREVALGMQALKRIGSQKMLRTSSRSWRQMRRDGSLERAFRSMVGQNSDLHNADQSNIRML